MKLRLLYFITSLEIGGAQMGMVRIINSLPRSKYDIKVLSILSANDVEHKIDRKFIQVDKLRVSSKTQVYKLISGLLRTIRHFRPHVLVCSLFHATVIGRVIGTLAKVPVILNWEHSENFGNCFRRMLNLSTSVFSKHIIADSLFVYGATTKLIKHPDKVSILPIGSVDLKLYSPAERRSAQKVVRIGSIGSLREVKNFSFLIELAKCLPDVCFVEIAGNGPQFNRLRRMINDNRLENRVYLRGQVEDTPSFLSRLDIYVQPSLWEGLCISVVEAAASGLPILASNVGGIPETVKNGYNGFLVVPGDLEGFKEKLLKLVSDSDLRKNMGANSRALAEEKYPLDKMVDKFDTLITTLVRDRI